MAWKDGYVVEMEYVHGIHGELAPTSLNLALLAQAFEPIDPGAGFSYCELGCGQGSSLNLFAACHPEGEFHGIDFNAAHIAGAREQARRAGLDNAFFWEASFANLGEFPTSGFDFIVLHGVYSWVSLEMRRHIVNFLGSSLKPGGVVYLSYNSLPGWSTYAPIRELLLSRVDTLEGTLEERITQAIAYVRHLKEARAALFATSPAAAGFFDYISSLPVNYLAHEFFNRDWTLFYHADIVRELAAAGLTFAGSACFAENQDMLRFSEAQQRVIDDAGDRTSREMVKDACVNQLLRRDLFTRGRARLSPARQMELFTENRFSLSVPLSGIEHKALFPVGEVLLDRQLYDPILSALNEYPHSPGELLRRPEISQLGTGRVVEALIVLLAARHIMPASKTPTSYAAIRANRLNTLLLEQGPDCIGRQALASPLLGNVIRIDRLEKILLEHTMTADLRDPLHIVLKEMEQGNNANAASAESAKDTSAEAAARIASFRRDKLPLLRRLGIL